MTVQELIEELQSLPGAAQVALVWVDGSSDFSVEYVRGQVFIGDDEEENT